MFPHVSNANYLTLIGILVFLMAGMLMLSRGDSLLDKRRSLGIISILLGLYVAFWFGSRDEHGYGDTILYVINYNAIDISASLSAQTVDIGSEWFFFVIGYICRLSGMDYHGYLTVIALVYAMTAVFAAIRFDPSRPYLCTLFIFSSLMFLGFGLNGLRNGMACHMILLAMAFLLDDRRITAAMIAFLALGIHRSTILPISGIIAAMTVLRDRPRIALGIWSAAIPLSLLFGEAITNIIMSLGYDERMTVYAGGELEGQDEFSSTGFRWDFLLYSALPIGFYFYVNIVKGLRDGWYNVIAITYMLANAFWIIVIRAEFSNRFAYLSWFIYPIMFAYPLANMKIWKNQSTMAAICLISYYGITWGLYKFVWNYI